MISKKVEKLAEVNRIVEIYSQQRRETIQRSNSNGASKSRTSNLIIERLPTVNKLGEINRVTLIKLVDHQNDSKAKEFLSFLTTTAQPAIDSDTTPRKLKEKNHEPLFHQKIYLVLKHPLYHWKVYSKPIEMAKN